MTDERCKQLMEQVGYPNSISLKEALFQVANETEQEVRASLSAPVAPVAGGAIIDSKDPCDYCKAESKYCSDDCAVAKIPDDENYFEGKALAAPLPVAPAVDAVTALEGVKRYYYDYGHDVGGPGSGMHESNTGKWCRHDDVLRALQIKEG